MQPAVVGPGIQLQRPSPCSRHRGPVLKYGHFAVGAQLHLKLSNSVHPGLERQVQVAATWQRACFGCQDSSPESVATDMLQTLDASTCQACQQLGEAQQA